MHSSKKILVSVAFFIVATLMLVQLSLSSPTSSTYAQTNPTRTPEAETNPTRTPSPPLAELPVLLPIMVSEGSATSIASIASVSGGQAVNGSLLTPLDIRFDNPTWSDNPFDLIAVVTFTHQGSSTTRQTEMYYNGGNEWRARFTADRTGLWTYTTQSSDGNLNGITGSITIADSAAKGFVVADGDKWSRSGSGQAFVPQYAMAAELDRFLDNSEKISGDLDTFMGDHGFTGFHLRGYCHWFELGNDRCSNISAADRDPDIQTFEVVENIIFETYTRGWKHTYLDVR